MSELINNSKLRQDKLKLLIKEIHQGMPINLAKERFIKDFKEISTDEIVALEQSLVDEGMSVEEIQSLCDVHAAVFNTNISDLHKPREITEIPGHPAKVFLDENIEISKLIEEEIEKYLDKTDQNSFLMLRIGIDRLSNIKNHYARKEYLFFPTLEKKGITSIPKVMWGVDDEIRADVKKVINLLNNKDAPREKSEKHIKDLLVRIKDMIIKENNILLPKLVDIMSFYDWILADQGSQDIGYFLSKPKESWKKEFQENKSTEEETKVFANVGLLESNEVNQILNTLPLDLTFIDKDGYVKYFSKGKERIFERPQTIIGRHVNLCHPPKSVDKVEAIIESFRKCEKDNEDFYIHLKDKYVLIRYFAIRDHEGEYMGTLEITQDIKPIQAIQGEKRLID